MKYEIKKHNETFTVYINSTVEKIFNLHEGDKFLKYATEAIERIFPLIAKDEKNAGIFYIEKAILKELYRRISKEDRDYNQNFLVIILWKNQK